ncbi:general secretion pathway protein GspB [Shewanella sp. CG12_big_fil_rev_8_21_14_0_65_47_15]|uniref:general secretion pathway protein GspB n=1 Tax=Shewanella sp. CG12_big_fil_rev_8_21_14_0_65_47_15 TaxID=1975537 RepID=UPI000CC25A27|nr:general secretion pathway protein GspB [Shewanella sp. CG12_big_fil_rev_8_21_14_0_65_47_15]PIW59365.1 MAG: general secretion pathway protein GspB [Shewanella sp. CG12_big_fil_rev_8_21_14_0_65_47_15]
MSILLDAVTRNKQQQSSPLPDAVLTPRAHYPQPRQASVPVAKLSALALAIALGVGVAWGVAMYRQSEFRQSELLPADKPPVGVSAMIAATTPTAQTVVQRAAQGTVTDSERTTTAQISAADNLNTGIRLAGKVALPRAQELNGGASVVPAPSNANSYGVSSIPQNRDPSYQDYLTTSAVVDATTPDSSQYSVIDENGINPAELAQMPVSQEPIMLGAGANHQGLEQLEALRQQVSAAAADVGLETNQSRKDDQLVATFQDALKDVEYVKAAKTPVTEPKLDPIPKPAGDDIPKYGQLPAGLQLQVPEFNIVAHVYSTDASQRWLNVDGAELQEGDMIGGKLKIISIRPRDVVLDIQGTQFKVPAI